ITIPFDPNIHIGPLTIAWHGVFTAVGILFGVWLALRLVRGRFSEDDATAVATWGVVGGIVGARLVHVIDRWEHYLANPLEIFLIWTGGIAVWGAAIGGVLAGLFVAIRRNLPIGFGADAAAPGILLGFAIGRIGDIINGEHWATRCEPPLGLCVGFTHPGTLGQGPAQSAWTGPVHLVVAYDMAWNLVGVAGALALRGRGLPSGLIFWLAAAWYALGRFLLGFLRINDPMYAFGLREDQIIGILVLAAAFPMIVRLTARGRSPAPA
ncbi:MAG TPA: prolipoprotein diacylglyceryl transferase, partial [Candidatus Limnocylindria bacterium]|nr:prolipoprotein diacylglyceryl transferase [Candidatus Limnocylindria bacterium]